MRAFHSFWSAPNILRSGGAVEIEDFELLTAMLSALNWRRHNGEIFLITDTPGAAYLENLGLAGLWDEIRLTLDAVPRQVDPLLFWAAGKLYALGSMEEPCVMLDTDLVVWKDLSDRWTCDVIAAHGEELDPAVYPDPMQFLPKEAEKESYSYPSDWDFTLPAANTAFLYIKDPEFKNHYVNEAFRFLLQADPSAMNTVTGMCFAEQRLLPMCAQSRGKQMNWLLEWEDLEKQQLVTHTWGYKQALREDPKLRQEFCGRCVRRILEDFPGEKQLILGTEALRKYYIP